MTAQEFPRRNWKLDKLDKLCSSKIHIMYQSNRSLNIPPPPNIPQAFDVFSCPGGWEFNESSLPGGGALITTHRRWGI